MRTIKIASPDTKEGYIIINEEDLVEGEHELFVEKEDSQSVSKAKEPQISLKTKAPTKAELSKLSKSELLARAEEAKIKIDSPDDLKTDQIVEMILAALKG